MGPVLTCLWDTSWSLVNPRPCEGPGNGLHCATRAFLSGWWECGYRLSISLRAPSSHVPEVSREGPSATHGLQAPHPHVVSLSLNPLGNSMTRPVLSISPSWPPKNALGETEAGLGLSPMARAREGSAQLSTCLWLNVRSCIYTEKIQDQTKSKSLDTPIHCLNSECISQPTHTSTGKLYMYT